MIPNPFVVPATIAAEDIVTVQPVDRTDPVRSSQRDPYDSFPADTHNRFPRLHINVRQARLAAGMRQVDLAAAIKRTRGTITNLESGKQGVSIGTLQDIAQVTGTQVCDLLNG